VPSAVSATPTIAASIAISQAALTLRGGDTRTIDRKEVEGDKCAPDKTTGIGDGAGPFLDLNRTRNMSLDSNSTASMSQGSIKGCSTPEMFSPGKSRALGKGGDVQNPLGAQQQPPLRNITAATIERENPNQCPGSTVKMASGNNFGDGNENDCSGGGHDQDLGGKGSSKDTEKGLLRSKKWTLQSASKECNRLLRHRLSMQHPLLTQSCEACPSPSLSLSICCPMSLQTLLCKKGFLKLTLPPSLFRNKEPTPRWSRGQVPPPAYFFGNCYYVRSKRADLAGRQGRMRKVVGPRVRFEDPCVLQQRC
jgi:hypothetical protein